MKLFLGSITLLVFNSLFLGSAFAQSYDVSGVQVLTMDICLIINTK